MTGEGGVAMDVNALRMRRATVFAIGIGVLTLAATGPLDRLLLGLFICIGLGLGWVNAQLTRLTVNRVADAGGVDTHDRQSRCHRFDDRKWMDFGNRGRDKCITHSQIRRQLSIGNHSHEPDPVFDSQLGRQRPDSLLVLFLPAAKDE